ncbi:hypothetical protein AAC387_Pa01g3044 [Persea americana]
MDKSWTLESRVSIAYEEGVKRFLDFSFANAISRDTIKCPCKNCSNVYYRSRDEVYEHLICDGFEKSYARGVWIFHGEKFALDEDVPDEDVPDEVDDMHGMLRSAFGIQDPESSSQEPEEGPNAEVEKFYKLVEDADQELYPGCKNFTKLAFVVRLYHIKCLNGWSNKSFTMLLDLLKEAFPEGETLPKSFYETKKIIGELGLGYNKIDACPNDCMLYWKQTANESVCSVCGTSRWKTYDDGASPSCSKERKIPAKIVRHFPLKPRLQRLFMSDKTSSFMRWHAEGRTNDGVLRHPADSLAWQSLDNRYPDFAAEPRNVRLGLASDGFNPFGTMSIAHSTWPVVLIPYNLPPWMCMKQPFFVMSLLIPGPRGPGNDIDVYLQPLVDELKELWEDGLHTWDASSNQNFLMRTVLLWTINDFPAYANLSGWSTKGRFACPHCNEDTCSYYLSHGKKLCYMSHRRFLDADHRFRRNKIKFDGKMEFRAAPLSRSGMELLHQCCDINITFGKHNSNSSNKKRKRDDNTKGSWKKKSIFFTLPYWEHLLIRHNLDVMHIEKNICDSIVGTLLNIEGKTKDTLQARLDLKDMGIRPALHPYAQGHKTYLPSACFSMAQKEKDIFCKVLSRVKVPDGYAANISRSVRLKEHKIFGLKSHDCHILMQQLLPLAVRRALPKNASAVLIELSNFFRGICSKTGTVEALNGLESRISTTLCHLEMIFPPAFFDIMVHLAIHLAREARIAGPVQYRWMYPIERYLLTLKSYVRNRSRPEGSIAEGYLAEECLTFCSRYLHDVETRSTRAPRNYDDGTIETNQMSLIFSRPGRALGKETSINLTHDAWGQMHRYILFNCTEVAPFLEEHRKKINTNNRHKRQIDRERMHNDQFPKWFESHVDRLRLEGDERVTTDLRLLARGPSKVATSFSKFVINGFRFRTKDFDRKSKTQNSGVVVTAKTPSFASAKDKNPIVGDVTYYGVLTDIIQLDYYEDRKVVLFKCDWVDVTSQGRGIKLDELGFTLVNLKRLLSTNEPFVLASQALQVFYVEDPVERDWHVAIKTKPRDFFDMHGNVNVNEEESYLESRPYDAQQLEDICVDADNISEVRADVPGTTIDTLIGTQATREDQGDDSEFDDTEFVDSDIII